ncbi:hypothetical protein DFP94_102278 [Fontibacillus phaseoli]|uniref:ABC-2 family transporter n=2 Tax=Fontibacillus phaseoli TaxID=1416533 RepID=A0A369BK86_9BACL|nr:hypothetical protein DFP94_102278 [Fontibacillus phaseoli]
MNKLMVLLKASFYELRIYLLCITGIVAVNVIASVVVHLSLGGEHKADMSVANLFTISLIFVASILPISFFKRIINLGASRKEYYVGVLVINTIWSAVFSLFNTLWLQIEIGVIRKYEHTINILEIFHWDQFGLVGMFVYQFGAYMMLMSLLNLLFSGLRHFVGWIIWLLLIAAIPIATSLSSLRPKVADGFLMLFFNDSLLQGFGLTFLFSCIFMAGGWLFTRRRTI